MKDIWAEGKWWDMWTLVHFLSGALIGAFLEAMGLSLSMSIAIAGVLFILWEVFELIVKWEHLTNQFADLVINYLGYGFFYLLHYVWGIPFGWTGILGLTALIILLNLFGIRAAIRRKKNKKQI